MELGVQFQRLYRVQIQRLLVVLGIIVFIAVLVQLSVIPYKNYASALSHATKGSVFVRVESTTLPNCSQSTCLDVVQRAVNGILVSEDKSGEETERESMVKDYELRSDNIKEMDNSVQMDENGQSRNDVVFDRNLDLDKSVSHNSSTREMGLEFQFDPMGHVKESGKLSNTGTFSTPGLVHNLSSIESAKLWPTRITTNKIETLDAKSRTPLLSIAGKISSAHNETQHGETQSKDTNNELLQIPASWRNNSFVAGNSIINKRGTKSTSISQMTILLLRGADASKSMVCIWNIKVFVRTMRINSCVQGS